jgi:hypothetical protein
MHSDPIHDPLHIRKVFVDDLISEQMALFSKTVILSLGQIHVIAPGLGILPLYTRRPSFLPTLVKSGDLPGPSGR